MKTIGTNLEVWFKKKIGSGLTFVPLNTVHTNLVWLPILMIILFAQSGPNFNSLAEKKENMEAVHGDGYFNVTSVISQQFIRKIILCFVSR